MISCECRTCRTFRTAWGSPLHALDLFIRRKPCDEALTRLPLACRKTHHSPKCVLAARFSVPRCFRTRETGVPAPTGTHRFVFKGGSEYRRGVHLLHPCPAASSLFMHVSPPITPSLSPGVCWNVFQRRGKRKNTLLPLFHVFILFSRTTLCEVDLTQRGRSKTDASSYVQNTNMRMKTIMKQFVLHEYLGSHRKHNFPNKPPPP